MDQALQQMHFSFVARVALYPARRFAARFVRKILIVRLNEIRVLVANARPEAMTAGQRLRPVSARCRESHLPGLRQTPICRDNGFAKDWIRGICETRGPQYALPGS